MASDKSGKAGILLPPAVGYSFKLFLKLLRKNKITPRYYFRVFAIILINLINLPFRVYERKRINPKFAGFTITEEPVFIIGHWRSGTTYLHNLLSLDPQMGYVSTFQSVFPDTLFNLAGRWLFKTFTSLLIPGTRKGDNVVLDASFPQEEEFILGDRVPISFYYFWMFPRNIQSYYDRFIRFKDIPVEMKETWKKNYQLQIKKALKNTGGKRFLSKNPPHTARIDVLLEMFPHAKFVYIHRNPVEVFLSTRHFFRKMMPYLQLQTISDKEVGRQIIRLYRKLMNDYFEQKKLIPEKNLVEIAYEELEKNPASVLKNIYARLDLPGYDTAEPFFSAYIKQMRKYSKNVHTIRSSELEMVLKEWGFAMKKYRYGIPENITVTEQ